MCLGLGNCTKNKNSSQKPKQIDKYNIEFLVKHLRYCVEEPNCEACCYCEFPDCEEQLMLDAANALDELYNELENKA